MRPKEEKAKANIRGGILKELGKLRTVVSHTIYVKLVIVLVQLCFLLYLLISTQINQEKMHSFQLILEEKKKKF